jgi:lipopolysaccharide heptosyltransferase II
MQAAFLSSLRLVPMNPSRIVVRAPNWLGDIVMALPALATVRQHYPQAHLSVALPEAFGPLMSAVPGVDGVVWMQRGGGLSATRVNTRTFRAGTFDLGVLFTGSFSSALILYQAEVPQRWGYDGEMRGRLLTRAVVRPRQSQRLPGETGPPRPHHAAYYQRLLQAVGMTPVASVPPLHLPDQFRLRADRLYEAERWPVIDAPPMIALAPGAAYGSAKRWPAVHVAALVLRLIDCGFRPVFVGAKTDLGTIREVEAALANSRRAKPVAGRHYLNLVGKTELAQLMAVLVDTWAIVSNDSGAMHLASAFGRPVVALFGPTDEQVTAPLWEHVVLTKNVSCRPCMLRQCPIDHRCLRELQPDEVFAAVERVQRQPDHSRV